MWWARRKKVGRIPLTGNKEVDLPFCRIVRAVRKGKVKVYKVKILRDPDNRRKEIAGFLCDGHREVYVIHELPDWPAQKVLIHEGLHFLYDELKEEVIEGLEDFFWDNLTDKQKKYLLRFVPKHFVKRDPTRIDKLLAVKRKSENKK